MAVYYEAWIGCLALTLTIFGPAPLLVSGQSIALAVAPLLAEQTPVIGFQRGATPIAYWDEGAEGWHRLTASMHGQQPRAFVWCQGESDGEPMPLAAGLYHDKLASLIDRVRHYVHDPTLPVRICQLGPRPSFASISAEVRAYVQHDPHARLVATEDLPFLPDQTHLTPEGYRALAKRILASVP